MANYWVTAWFTSCGIPKSGLVPLVNIYRLSDDAHVVVNGVMTEVTPGKYKYDFVGYDHNKSYSAICNGGSSLCDEERYTSGDTGISEGSIADAVWDETINDHLSSGSTGLALKRATKKIIEQGKEI